MYLFIVLDEVVYCCNITTANNVVYAWSWWGDVVYFNSFKGGHFVLIQFIDNIIDSSALWALFQPLSSQTLFPGVFAAKCVNTIPSKLVTTKTFLRMRTYPSNHVSFLNTGCIFGCWDALFCSPCWDILDVSTHRRWPRSCFYAIEPCSVGYYA